MCLVVENFQKNKKKKKQKAILKERDRDKNQAAIVGSFKSKIW